MALYKFDFMLCYVMLLYYDNWQASRRQISRLFYDYIIPYHLYWFTSESRNTVEGHSSPRDVGLVQKKAQFYMFNIPHRSDENYASHCLSSGAVQ